MVGIDAKNAEKLSDVLEKAPEGSSYAEFECLFSANGAIKGVFGRSKGRYVNLRVTRWLGENKGIVGSGGHDLINVSPKFLEKELEKVDMKHKGFRYLYKI